jgi:hypothetical protein
MAAATQPTYVPLEVYLKSSYEPDAEYVDGVIEERPMGENDHSAWQHALDGWFGQHEKGVGHSRTPRASSASSEPQVPRSRVHQQLAGASFSSSTTTQIPSPPVRPQ